MRLGLVFRLLISILFLCQFSDAIECGQFLEQSQTLSKPSEDIATRSEIPIPVRDSSFKGETVFQDPPGILSPKNRALGSFKHNPTLLNFIELIWMNAELRAIAIRLLKSYRTTPGRSSPVADDPIYGFLKGRVNGDKRTDDEIRDFRAFRDAVAYLLASPTFSESIVSSAMHDLRVRSERLKAQLKADPDQKDLVARTWDVLVVGAGRQGSVFANSLYVEGQASGKRFKTLTVDQGYTVASTFALLDYFGRLNSSDKGHADGKLPIPRAGGPLNGFPNGSFQTGDFSTQRYNPFRTMSDPATLNRSQNPHDILLGAELVGVKDSLLYGIKGWPARYRLEFEIDGRVEYQYAERWVWAGGIGKPDFVSVFDRTTVKLIEEEMARGFGSRIDTASSYAEKTALTPNPYRSLVDQEILIAGPKDYGKVVLEYVLRGGTREGYGDDVVATGDPKKVFWVGPRCSDCQSFINDPTTRGRYLETIGTAFKSGRLDTLGQRLVRIRRAPGDRFLATYNIVEENGNTISRDVVVDRVILGFGTENDASLVFSGIAAFDSARKPFGIDNLLLESEVAFETIEGRILIDDATPKKADILSRLRPVELIDGSPVIAESRGVPQETYVLSPARPLATSKELFNNAENNTSDFTNSQRSRESAKFFVESFTPSGFPELRYGRSQIKIGKTKEAPSDFAILEFPDSLLGFIADRRGRNLNFEIASRVLTALKNADFNREANRKQTISVWIVESVRSGSFVVYMEGAKGTNALAELTQSLKANFDTGLILRQLFDANVSNALKIQISLDKESNLLVNSARVSLESLEAFPESLTGRVPIESPDFVWNRLPDPPMPKGVGIGISTSKGELLTPQVSTSIGGVVVGPPVEISLSRSLAGVTQAGLFGESFRFLGGIRGVEVTNIEVDTPNPNPTNVVARAFESGVLYEFTYLPNGPLPGAEFQLRRYVGGDVQLRSFSEGSIALDRGRSMTRLKYLTDAVEQVRPSRDGSALYLLDVLTPGEYTLARWDYDSFERSAKGFSSTKSEGVGKIDYMRVSPDENFLIVGDSVSGALDIYYIQGPNIVRKVFSSKKSNLWGDVNLTPGDFVQGADSLYASFNRFTQTVDIVDLKTTFLNNGATGFDVFKVKLDKLPSSLQADLFFNPGLESEKGVLSASVLFRRQDRYDFYDARKIEIPFGKISDFELGFLNELSDGLSRSRNVITREPSVFLSPSRDLSSDFNASEVVARRFAFGEIVITQVSLSLSQGFVVGQGAKIISGEIPLQRLVADDVIAIKTRPAELQADGRRSGETENIFVMNDGVGTSLSFAAEGVQSLETRFITKDPNVNLARRGLKEQNIGVKKFFESYAVDVATTPRDVSNTEMFVLGEIKSSSDRGLFRFSSEGIERIEFEGTYFFRGDENFIRMTEDTSIFAVGNSETGSTTLFFKNVEGVYQKIFETSAERYPSQLDLIPGEFVENITRGELLYASYDKKNNSVVYIDLSRFQESKNPSQVEVFAQKVQGDLLVTGPSGEPVSRAVIVSGVGLPGGEKARVNFIFFNERLRSFEEVSAEIGIGRGDAIPRASSSESLLQSGDRIRQVPGVKGEDITYPTFALIIGGESRSGLRLLGGNVKTPQMINSASFGLDGTVFAYKGSPLEADVLSKSPQGFVEIGPKEGRRLTFGVDQVSLFEGSNGGAASSEIVSLRGYFNRYLRDFDITQSGQAVAVLETYGVFESSVFRVLAKPGDKQPFVVYDVQSNLSSDRPGNLNYNYVRASESGEFFVAGDSRTGQVSFYLLDRGRSILQEFFRNNIGEEGAPFLSPGVFVDPLTYVALDRNSREVITFDLKDVVPMNDRASVDVYRSRLQEIEGADELLTQSARMEVDGSIVIDVINIRRQSEYYISTFRVPPFVSQRIDTYTGDPSDKAIFNNIYVPY